MSDRITPYEEGGDIKERIDEIVASGVDVHFEMMDETGAMLICGGSRFMLYPHRGQLICRCVHKEPSHV